MAIELRSDSRYLRTKMLRDSAGNLHYHIWTPLEIEPERDDTTHEMTETDLGRFDLLGTRKLGNQRYWWMIPHLNKMEDPFSMPDFSECDEMQVYPNYPSLSFVDEITYPATAQKDIRLPEYEVGTRLDVPSRARARRVMLDAAAEQTTAS